MQYKEMLVDPQTETYTNPQQDVISRFQLLMYKYNDLIITVVF